jgi:hypothetical protein
MRRGRTFQTNGPGSAVVSARKRARRYRFRDGSDDAALVAPACRLDWESIDGSNRRK